MELRTPRESSQGTVGAGGHLSRRALLRGTLGLAGAALLAACGGNSTATTAPSAPASAAPSAAPSAAAGGGATATSGAARSTAPSAAAAGSATPTAGFYPSPAPGVPDAYDIPPKPFKSVQGVPGRGGKVTALLTNTQPPPPPRDQNRYWQELEKRLGVTWEPTLVAGGAYDEKFATTIASGELPDYVALANTPDQLRAINQGAFADLTPYLTGDALKAYPNMARIPAQIWKNVTIKGKIVGVPKARTLAGSPLLFRRDWAEKIGNAQPKNADEFADLLTKFTKGDPDGNGQADTFALGSGVDTLDRYCLTFFRNMFRVPYNWRKNADGTLTSFIETDEFKQTLAYMNKLYTAGVFHPDAATLGSQQNKDLFGASKIGGYGDTITGMPGQLTNVPKTAPNAKVVGLVPFGFDGGKAVSYNSLGWASYIGISAKVARDKDRLQELLRIFDYFCAPFGSEEKVFLDNGIEGVHHTVQPNGVWVVNDLGTKEIVNLAYVVNGPFVFFSATLPGYPQTAQGLARDLLAIGIDDPTTGLFSQTAATKGSELNQLQNDRVVAIVTGREPLTALDAWVKDWKSRGGDQIRKEYEQELKA